MKTIRAESTLFKGSRVFFIFIMLIALLAFSASAMAQERPGKFGTGNPQGSWYAFTVGMTEFLQKNTDIRLTVIPSSGGAEIIKNIIHEKVDFGWVFPGFANSAWNGLAPFKEKSQNFRAVGVIGDPAACHFVALKDSDVKSLRDLAGKTFSPGPLGSTTYLNVMTLLKDAGIADKVRIVNCSHSEQVSYLVDRKISAFALLAMAPVASITEASTMKPVRLLDLKALFDEIKFFEKHPYFSEISIKANSYPGVDYAATTFGEPSVLITHKNVDEKLVHDVTMALFSENGLAYLRRVHRHLEGMGKHNATKGLQFPFHPGAERAWKEMGVAIH